VKTAQPRKQHKMLFQAPLHIRYKLLSAPLSPALKASHKVSSVSVRTGDTVRIMRGDRKGTEGKVTQVNRSNNRLLVEGVTRAKVDGTTVQVPIHPSKVMITGLNLDDKWRREALKIEAPKEVEKPVEEPKKERKKRRPRKAPSKKATIPRKKKMKPAEAKTEEGEIKTG